MWIVGVDGEGHVRRLIGKSTLEPVSDRFGLADARVSAVASLGGHMSAFRLQDQIAVADGKKVARYATGGLSSFAGGGGRAVLGGEPLRVFDVHAQTVAAFRSPKLFPSLSANPKVAVTAKGKVVVASTNAIWAEDDHGDLRLRFETRGTSHGLTAAADRVWFADGTELGVLEGGRVRETTGASVSPSADLVGSPSGDVWTITAGTLARYAIVTTSAPDWNASIAPIFHRVCGHCHGVGGEAGVSLATAEAWDKRRDDIRRRVFVDGDMPPPGRTLTEPERAAIRAWIDR